MLVYHIPSQQFILWKRKLPTLTMDPALGPTTSTIVTLASTKHEPSREARWPDEFCVIQDSGTCVQRLVGSSSKPYAEWLETLDPLLQVASVHDVVLNPWPYVETDLWEQKAQFQAFYRVRPWFVDGGGGDDDSNNGIVVSRGPVECWPTQDCYSYSFMRAAPSTYPPPIPDSSSDLTKSKNSKKRTNKT